MSLYVMLSTLSESGRRVLRERPGWIRKINGDIERMGARVTMAAIPLDEFIGRLERRSASKPLAGKKTR